MDLKLPLPTLKRLSLIKTASCIVAHFYENILRREQDWRLQNHRLDWPTVSENVVAEVSSLSIPAFLSSTLKEAISDMWLDVRVAASEWLIFMSEFDVPEMERGAWRKMYFKNTGKLDLERMEVETIKIMMQDEEADLVYIFHLAICLYLGDVVEEVYKRMSLKEKSYIHAKMQKHLYNGPLWHAYLFQEPLDETWVVRLFHTSVIRKDNCKILSCWNKMRDDQKVVIAFDFLPSVVHDTKFSELIIDLLRHIPENKSAHVLGYVGPCILVIFLEWPYDEMFLTMVERFWDHLSIDHCFYLLRKIISKAVSNFSKPKFILREYWDRLVTSNKGVLSDQKRFRAFSVECIEQLSRFGKVDLYTMILVDVWNRTNGSKRYFSRAQKKFLQKVLQAKSQ